MKSAAVSSSATSGVAFATIADLEQWLRLHHATETSLWVRVFKKGSGVESVTWNDLVIAGLIWGWIDGLKRSLDDASFLQRMTPRRPKSTWSKKNCEHAERLITEGRMQPSGLAHVDAAKADGRWERAYDGAAAMVIPDDFLAAVHKNTRAQANFDALDRGTLFRIYFRLHTAKQPATRKKRIESFVAQLTVGTAIT